MTDALLIFEIVEQVTGTTTVAWKTGEKDAKVKMAIRTVVFMLTRYTTLPDFEIARLLFTDTQQVMLWKTRMFTKLTPEDKDLRKQADDLYRIKIHELTKLANGKI